MAQYFGLCRLCRLEMRDLLSFVMLSSAAERLDCRFRTDDSFKENPLLSVFPVPAQLWIFIIPTHEESNARSMTSSCSSTKTKVDFCAVVIHSGFVGKAPLF